jgi:hypothetical protein
MHYVISQAHRLAGRTSRDVRLIDYCGYHMRRYRTLPKVRVQRVSGILRSVADMESITVRLSY